MLLHCSKIYPFIQKSVKFYSFSRCSIYLSFLKNCRPSFLNLADPWRANTALPQATRLGPGRSSPRNPFAAFSKLGDSQKNTALPQAPLVPGSQVPLISRVLPSAMTDGVAKEAHTWCQADEHYYGDQMYGAV